MAAKLHFAENSLALHFLLEGLEGLIDIVVANEYLHGLSCILRPGLERSEDWRAHSLTWAEAQVVRRVADGLFLVQSACASAANDAVP